MTNKDNIIQLPIATQEQQFLTDVTEDLMNHEVPLDFDTAYHLADLMFNIGAELGERDRKIEALEKKLKKLEKELKKRKTKGDRKNA